MRKIFSLLGLATLLLLSTNVFGAAKREFRGAWIQCVNGQFIGLGTEKMQQTLTYQLDELQKDGVNAIIFQVRPECDALEPFSDRTAGRGTCSLLGSSAVDDYRVS